MERFDLFLALVCVGFLFCFFAVYVQIACIALFGITCVLVGIFGTFESIE